MITPLIQTQFDQLLKTSPGATMQALPDGSVWVVVPGVAAAPPGAWSHPAVTVRFLLPLGFPQARPDCFWADPELRLAGGGLPQNSAIQDAPHGAGQQLWFSWHVAHWNPQVDTVQTYLNVVRRRLQEAR